MMKLGKYKAIGGLCLGIAAALAVAGCSMLSAIHSSAQEETALEDPVLTPKEKANRIVAQMTDSQKIGQLMMIGIYGTSLNGDSRYMLTEFPNGNVILFDRNMETLEQVKQLNADIQKTVKQSTGVPAFIGVDQEGGQVARMETYMPPMPAAAVLGQQSPAVAADWARQTGRMLKDIGFNTNFAPVVDLAGAYQRSYGNTPQEVIPFAKTVIDAYKETGIFTSLKHFPGIGKVKTDPHIDGDVVNISRADLDVQDGKPYKDLIPQIDNTTFIMVSNVTFPGLDPNVPACLSKTIMTDVLRHDYGYQGLILTDDMEMGAMAKHYAFSEMGVKAIQAGADIVLVCQDYGHEQEVYNGLLKAYRNGDLDKTMVDEKVRRIVEVKLMKMK